MGHKIERVPGLRNVQGCSAHERRATQRRSAAHGQLVKLTGCEAFGLQIQLTLRRLRKIARDIQSTRDVRATTVGTYRAGIGEGAARHVEGAGAGQQTGNRVVGKPPRFAENGTGADLDGPALAEWARYLQCAGTDVDGAAVVEVDGSSRVMGADGVGINRTRVVENCRAQVDVERRGVAAAQIDGAASCIGQRVGSGQAQAKEDQVVAGQVERALVDPGLAALQAHVAVGHAHVDGGRALSGQYTGAVERAGAADVERPAQREVGVARQRAAGEFDQRRGDGQWIVHIDRGARCDQQGAGTGKRRARVQVACAAGKSHGRARIHIVQAGVGAAAD